MTDNNTGTTPSATTRSLDSVSAIANQVESEKIRLVEADLNYTNEFIKGVRRL